jgi:TPR repeat protein
VKIAWALCHVTQTREKRTHDSLPMAAIPFDHIHHPRSCCEAHVIKLFLSSASIHPAMSSSAPFRLPPLYFQDKGSSLVASGLTLPSEVVQVCLTEFATWGDLAKLACVQKTWKNTMYDAALCSGPESQWNLACAMLEGKDGLQQNTEKALRLLQQLVAHVVSIDPVTQRPVYDAASPAATDANGVYANDDDEMNECKYAAKAMKKLARFYLLDGNSTENGLDWLKCAFEAGDDVESAHDLALIYEYGKYNVPTDVVAAAVYFEKAALAGHVDAMAELALCYELGCGVTANDETALDWYIKAATAGHVTAKYAVGEAFEEARGVPQSDAEACLWYYKAAIEGDEDSRKALRRLEAIARIVVPGVRALLGE